MALVEYTNKQGYIYMKLVPDESDTRDYHMGITVGPPDLDEVPIEEEERLLLHNALAREKLLRYPDLSGNRGKLLELIRRSVKSMDAKDARYWIMRAYQKQMFPENFGGLNE